MTVFIDSDVMPDILTFENVINICMRMRIIKNFSLERHYHLHQKQTSIAYIHADSLKENFKFLSSLDLSTGDRCIRAVQRI